MIIDRINEFIFERHSHYFFLIVGIVFAWFTWGMSSIMGLKLFGGIMAFIWIFLGICMTRAEYLNQKQNTIKKDKKERKKRN